MARPRYPDTSGGHVSSVLAGRNFDRSTACDHENGDWLEQYTEQLLALSSRDWEVCPNLDIVGLSKRLTCSTQTFLPSSIAERLSQDGTNTICRLASLTKSDFIFLTKRSTVFKLAHNINSTEPHHLHRRSKMDM